MSLRTASSDARLLRALLENAERLALESGHERPALEHLLAAALAHSDESARRALGLDAAEFVDALRHDDADALRRVGIEPPREPLGAPAPAPRVYDGAPSLDETVRLLARSRRGGSRLRTVDILIAALEHPTGAVTRALGRLGVEPARALRAAHEEARS